MSELATIAPAFVSTAHRIVWCIAATVDLANRPTSRVLHPVWEWDESELTGWIATGPNSVKARHLARVPSMSVTYWDSSHDVCTADCDVTWDDTPSGRSAGWNRFVNSPAPVGYDPAVIPGWESPESPSFGVLRLLPRRLRVMPGSMLTTGSGELLTWNRQS